MKAYGTCWWDLSEYRLGPTSLCTTCKHLPPENNMGWNDYTKGVILECKRANFIENEKELIYHDVLCTM